MASAVLDLAKKNLGLAADPKLDFRATTLHRLSTSAAPIPASAGSYWSTFFTVFDTPSDVPTLITAFDLRQALQNRPENVATLVRVTTRRLVHLVENDGGAFGDRERAQRMAEAAQRQGWRGLTSVVPKGLKEGAAGFIGAGGVPGAAQGKLRELLNCVRVLSRVLPFVVDVPEDERQPLGRDFLWKPGEPSPSSSRTEPTNVSTSEAAQFVIEDDEDDPPSASTAPPAPTSLPPLSIPKEPPLAVTLIRTVLSLLFLPGVTLPAPELDSPRVVYPIWTAGIGSPSSPPIEHSPAHDAAKVEALRLLLVLLSEPLYQPPHLYALALEDDAAASNPALDYLVRETPKKLVLALLCSLINTALGTVNIGTPLSFVGLSNLAMERISRKSGAESLPTVCAQFLGVLLMPSPSEPAPPTPGTERPLLDRGVSAFSVRSVSGASAPPSLQNDPNSFRFYLAKLHRPADFAFLFDGIMATLNRPMAVTTQLLPDSSSTVASNVKESLLLLFLLSDSNPRFLDWLVASDNSKSGPDVVVALLFFCLEHKESSAQIGLVRLCAVLLQLLTAHKALGPRLNAPVELQVAIRSKYGVPGTTADFLIVSVCSLIFSTKGALASLYPSLVVCLTNVSPHVKGLSALAATRLVQLFLAFSAPGFVLAEDGNVRLVYYLLEAFNNIVHYQFSANPQVIYALIRAHARFDMLANFTVSDGVQEIRRKRQLREREAAAAASESEGAGGRRTVQRRRSSGVSLMSPRLSESAMGVVGRRDSEGAEVEAEKRPLTTPSVEDVSGPTGSPTTLTSTADGTDPNDLVAPSTDDLALTGKRGISEKRKGKMRQGSLSVAGKEDGEGEEEAGFVGKNGFVPTESWVASWRDSLPLDSIQIMVAELRPKVSSLSTVSSASTTHAVLDFLSSTSPSPLSPSLLPPAPPLKSRRFNVSASPAALGWLGGLVWSLVFVKDAEWYEGAEVRLFGVKKGQRGGGGERLRELGRALSGFTFGGGSGQGGGSAGQTERPRENGSV